MKKRTNSAFQLVDLLLVVFGSLCCVFAVIGAAWCLWKRDWSMASLLVLLGGAVWITRVYPALRRLREARQADAEFEAAHRRSLDWKGDPIETKRENAPKA